MVSEKFLYRWERAGFLVDTVIFKVIKKPLVLRLSQVIHKAVIQNPVRNQEGLGMKKWLLLHEDIISNCPSEKAPPQSPVYELNRCHLERPDFISSGIFSSNIHILRKSSDLFAGESGKRLNTNY